MHAFAIWKLFAFFIHVIIQKYIRYSKKVKNKRFHLDASIENEAEIEKQII